MLKFLNAVQSPEVFTIRIPDFKLDKAIIDRRITIMREEGIVFTCSTEIGNTKYAKNF